MPPYGQVIVGPPGSGKSTYCSGMNEFLRSIGRHCCIVNMDPANDRLPYDYAIDIRDFVTLEEIMDDENLRLGPNGGLVYALEVIESNIEIFLSKVKSLIDVGKDDEGFQATYVLFDCPGQTELYTSSPIMNKIFTTLIKELDFRLCVVSLIDCVNIMVPSNYISSLLLSLRTMLQMDLPQVNVFTKIDLIKGYIDSDKMSKVSRKDYKRKTGEDDHDNHDSHEHYEHGDQSEGLPFDLQYYADVQDLSYLTPYVMTEENNSRKLFFKDKYQRLTELIAELIEDFGLLKFEVLSIEDKFSMIKLLKIIDKSNGYIFGSSEIGGDTIWKDIMEEGYDNEWEDIDIQERWVDNKEEYDELEGEKRKELEEYLQNAPEEEKHSVELDAEKEWELALKEWESKQI
ncbi:hypothetical protein B5S33_g2246 [[Candida] boidinii]|nr:hypothetical protein B5S33_g2246 [[Candida] boidinii]